MTDTNSVVIVGRITKDAELKYTKSGFAILNFTVALNSRKKQGDQWVDVVSFIDCVHYGKAAETIKQYMLKGRQVAVSGELKQERWESNGNNHSKVVIACNSVQLLGETKKQNNNTSNYGNSDLNSYGYDFPKDTPF